MTNYSEKRILTSCSSW